MRTEASQTGIWVPENFASTPPCSGFPTKNLGNDSLMEAIKNESAERDGNDRRGVDVVMDDV
ncbi:hypothetical protein ACFL6I_13250 [candidate division KSB1 bacterium]